MADLHSLGMRQCTDCARVVPHDQHCTHCNGVAPEVPELYACAGWGCPLRTRCALYLASNAAGAARATWYEPPFDHLTTTCSRYTPVERMEAVVDVLVSTLKKTIGRQNQN